MIDNMKSDMQKFSQWVSKFQFSGITSPIKLFLQVKETILCPCKRHNLIFEFYVWQMEKETLHFNIINLTQNPKARSTFSAIRHT